jgi:hypothetical protein
MNKIICRKCGGEHLTIKCGKEKETVEPEKVIETSTLGEKHSFYSNEPEKQTVEERKQEFHRNEQNKYNRDDARRNRNSYNEKVDRLPRERLNVNYKRLYTVKLSELPLDISEAELYELLQNWGHVVKIKVLVYAESATAYIDFGYMEEAVYFAEALHKTPFDSFIISAEVCSK